MEKKREMSESGMLVYPKLPVPKQRESRPSMPRSGGIGLRNVLLLFVVGIIGGATGGFFLRPLILEDARLVETEKALATERLALAEAKATLAKGAEESKKLDEQRELLDKQLEAAKQAQDMLADKAADRSKLEAELQAAKKKLEGAGVSSVTIDGVELRATIPANNLFKSGDDLSSGGLKVLDKVAAVLKELPDKQVAVHGHTDDTPPPKPKAPPAPKKGDKKPPLPAPAAPTFATNWELSALRGLAVVHYLQDKHKIEASRLSSAAFSQYRPVSKSRAVNRRIELVLTPKPAKK